MALCSKRFGYESPAVGAWTFALSLQLMLGVILVLVGYNEDGTTIILESMHVNTTNYAGMQYLGVGHLVVAVVVGAIVALGLFVSSCFLLPLCIISIIQSLFLVVTAGICGMLVFPLAQSIKISAFGETDRAAPQLQDIFLALHFGGYLLTAACLSLGALAAYGRASSMKNDTPIPEAQLYVPCAVLLVSSATIAAVGGAGEGPTIWMASILFGLAVGLAILVGVANCCCTPKVFNIVVGAGFACIAVFTLVCCGTSARIYRDVIATYKVFPFDNRPLEPPSSPYPSDWRVFVIMGGGRWLLALACTTLATSVLAIFSALYALRSVLFCFGKGDTA